MYEPARKKFARKAKGQFIQDTVGQDASVGALRLHFMRVIPATERARNLDVPELPSFDVIAVLEHPSNPEWAHMYTQNSAIAITDSRRPLYDFNGLPGWRQSLKRIRLRVPAKNNLCGRFNPRLGDELNLARHGFAGGPSGLWCKDARNGYFWAPVLTGAISATAAEPESSEVPISDLFRPSALAR
jgi:hypothetical protein